MLFFITKQAHNKFLACNEFSLLLLSQKASKYCVNNFEIYQYSGYSHNIAFTKLIHGAPSPLTAKDVIVSIKFRA